MALIIRSDILYSVFCHLVCSHDASLIYQWVYELHCNTHISGGRILLLLTRSKSKLRYLSESIDLTGMCDPHLIRTSSLWWQAFIKLSESSYSCHPYGMTEDIYLTNASFQKGVLKCLTWFIAFEKVKQTWLHCSGLKYCFEVWHPCQARKCKCQRGGKAAHLGTINKCQIFPESCSLKNLQFTLDISAWTFAR